MNILKTMYAECNKEIPEWIKTIAKPSGYEEAFEEEESMFITDFKKILLRNAESNVFFESNKGPIPIPMSIEDQITDVAYGRKEPWLSIQSPRSGKNKDKKFSN